MALSTADKQSVAAFFANNLYVNKNQCATMAIDTLTTAIGQIDTAVTVSATAVNASVTASATINGKFTLAQIQCLMAYVLLKRAGMI